MNNIIIIDQFYQQYNLKSNDSNSKIKKGFSSAIKN